MKKLLNLLLLAAVMTALEAMDESKRVQNENERLRLENKRLLAALTIELMK